MNKVIIRTREDELTRQMYLFGHDSAIWFMDSLESGAYGKDWNSCVYSSTIYENIKCLVKLNKNGTISACVFSK
jgi:hypothetical protein